VSTQGTTYPELRTGDTGEWVTYLQEQLQAQGYAPGTIDGEFGPLTEYEVRRLQLGAGLAETGVVDSATWAYVGGSASDPGDGEPEHYGPGGEEPATATATADQFVELCLAQEGDDYDYGVDVDLEDPDPASFDCAELVEWALAQLGVLDDLKGSWDWSQGQRAAIEAAGLSCSVDEARHVRGALLFNSHHVAVSLGDGVGTIEAMGEAFNVRKGKIDGTSGGSRFDGAGRVPNLQY
jgi:hypothetical protein